MNTAGINVGRARRDTPGCKNVLHFNNAGAALMPRPVLNAALDYLRLEAEIGGYEAAARSQETLEHVYDAIASLIGSRREEIAIVENATRAWDMAFYAISFRQGDRILTCVSEYGSNYIAFLQVAQWTGAKIEVIPNDDTGQVCVESLRRLLDHRVKLIAITHVPTNGGLVNPAAEVGRVAREANVLYLLDACQSVGQMPVDVREIGCDMLSATARKYLRGPRGAGFLYVRRGLIEHLEPPFLDLHAAKWVGPQQYQVRDDARRFENWESNHAAKISLGVAVEYALGWGLEAIQARVTGLAAELRDRIGRIPRIKVHDLGKQKCGLVTFTVDGVPSADVQRKLPELGMNVSVTTVGATRLDMERRHLDEVVRASVHYYNSEEEVRRFSKAVAQIDPE